MEQAGRSVSVFKVTGAGDWDQSKMAAAKSKPKKPRKPEEIWYDIHKHPEGVPGGMGKAPEHHLKARGWMSHEINEASGKKTIQYRSHDFPDFVLSYGGGSGSKPDHNFRVLYLGTNRNVPKVTRSYSVAEAMNKVEELHALQSGHVVVPMVHDASSPTAVVPSIAGQDQITRNKTFVAPQQKKRRQDMSVDDFYPIGKPRKDVQNPFPTRPDEESDWVEPKMQVQEIKPVRSKPKVSFYRLAQADDWYYHGTTAEDLDEVAPASSHRRGVIFPNMTDLDYAYATPSESNAWHYAELAWNAGETGIPRVYRVKPTGPVEEDPTHWPNGDSRGNFSDDVRSRYPFEVHEELPTPEHWQEDW